MRLPISALSEPLRSRLISRGVLDGKFVEVRREIFTEEIHHPDARLSPPFSAAVIREASASNDLEPVAVADWPAWALKASLEREPNHVGLGDTVAAKIAPFGSQAFKEWYAENVGVMAKVCGCANWQPLWNALYRYNRGD